MRRKIIAIALSRADNTTRTTRVALQWLISLTTFVLIMFALQTQAASSLCATGARCAPAAAHSAPTPSPALLDFAATMQLSGVASRHEELSSQEFFSFSGIGAIVCDADGKQRMSTAFLIGAFDLGVTVAHTFEHDGAQIAAEQCFYMSTDSLGQIREKIPVISVQTQWQTEAGARGQAAKDFAVVRLSHPSDYAQRTMPMGKFSGSPAQVMMIGFRSDMESDPLKMRSRGTVFERKANGISLATLEGYTHDIDARGIAAGAPVIDERSGVIVGIHTLAPRSKASGVARNTMITMNEWLENTLRAEMQRADEKGASR